jgi:sugar phosphate isomerase/epimerase
MILTRPLHSPEFYQAHGLGVETHITRYDILPNWPQYIPFTYGVHLPYAGMNLAALDDELRQQSLAKLESAFDEALRYPVDRMVMHTIGIEREQDEIVGSYDRMISALQSFADYAARQKIILCKENQLMPRPERRAIFGCTAKTWLQIHKDVARDNVMLTLDSSHASTSVAIFDSYEERITRLYDYLAQPELIGRIHWSDSRLKNQEALYHDMHLVPGKGDLPRDFHRKIKALDVIKLLEQKCSEEEVLEGLKFIETL